MTRSTSIGRVPEHYRDFAARRMAELLGAALLIGSAALTLALITWSARDPSLNHATDGRIRNLLGAPGAVVADLCMQLIGVAAIAALLPLAVLAWRLMTRRSIERFGLRLALWIIGVSAAAASASLLPVTDRWPLPTGLGGVVGDAILSLPRYATNNSGLAMAVVGLASIATAILCLSGAAGFGMETEADIRETSREIAYDAPRLMVEDEDEDDAAGEPGVAIASVGALIHLGLATRGMFSRTVAGAKNLFTRKEEAPPRMKRDPVPASERREPIFDEFEDYDAIDTLPTPRNLDEPEPVRSAPAPAAADRGRRVFRERPAAEARKNRPHAYEMPSLTLLAEPKKPAAGARLSQEALDQNARTLEGVLDDFSVRGEIINVRPGPVVTLYELEPAPGIKS
jgi:S-DNA-T family DNA segregation ATPase FtsK/SpoIIIE